MKKRIINKRATEVKKKTDYLKLAAVFWKLVHMPKLEAILRKQDRKLLFF